MSKRNLGYILLFFFGLSCSADKINLSPVGNSIQDNTEADKSYTYSESKNLIAYSSEITNLISSFPKFRNVAVNSEIVNLKTHLKDYIGAMEAHNLSALNNSQRKFEKSYKNLQKLRPYLNSDDDKILNRYLVRIKTNMALLESNITKDAPNTSQKNK